LTARFLFKANTTRRKNETNAAENIQKYTLFVLQ
jgi:hypothetical protein